MPPSSHCSLLVTVFLSASQILQRTSCLAVSMGFDAAVLFNPLFFILLYKQSAPAAVHWPLQGIPLLCSHTVIAVLLFCGYCMTVVPFFSTCARMK